MATYTRKLLRERGDGAGSRTGHGRAGAHGGIQRRRGRRCRSPGDDHRGAAGLRCRRFARQGGRRVARAGALGIGGARPVTAVAAHHGQPRAGQRLEGGQPFRSADRAGPARRDGGAAGGRTWRLHRARRGRARRLLDQRCRRAARRAGRGRTPERPDLSSRMRQRGGLGRRSRDHRGVEPPRDRQSLQGHPALAAARAEVGAAARSRARLQRRQRPGERQARPRNRRGGRPQPS
jgi:hypothetical protein